MFFLFVLLLVFLGVQHKSVLPLIYIKATLIVRKSFISQMKINSVLFWMKRRKKMLRKNCWGKYKIQIYVINIHILCFYAYLWSFLSRSNCLYNVKMVKILKKKILFIEMVFFLAFSIPFEKLMSFSCKL